MAEGLRRIFDEKEIPNRVNLVGSMFFLYFLDEEVVNVDTVTKRDFSIFKKLFWGCLEKGVYLAPSPYETGFTSREHSVADIDDILDVIQSVVAKW